MLFKLFNDASSNFKVAVNPNQVKYVLNTPSMGPKIIFADNSYIIVSGKFEEVLKQLSEK